MALFILFSYICKKNPSKQIFVKASLKMKKTLLLITIFGIILSLKAQNQIDYTVESMDNSVSPSLNLKNPTGFWHLSGPRSYETNNLFSIFWHIGSYPNGTFHRYFSILDNGNIGIGTHNPDMKLTVKGTIHAEEVKIDLTVPVPDYVFKNDYKLRSIEEVEKFILEYSHLPEIPSAKEFEQKGIMQAEMDMNLLKKIEELTLYTIKQHKEIERLKLIEKRIEKIEKRLESKK